MKYLEQRETRAHGTFDFPFGYYNIKSNHPRYHMVDHWHTEYEIIRINKGEFHFSLNGHKHIGIAGDIFIVPDGALHGGTPRKCHYECLVFNFHSVIELSPICKQLAQPVLLGSAQFINHIINCDEGLRQSADKLFSSLSCSEPYAPFQVISATFAFMGRLLEGYTEDRVEKSKDAEMRSVSRIKDVLRLIRNHYHEEITLDDLADSAHMNKRYFCRYFREVMGKTPMRYLNYYRVECACELLASSDRSVSEVAMACGYRNISYFTRAFRLLKGITPSAYAKVH